MVIKSLNMETKLHRESTIKLKLVTKELSKQTKELKMSTLLNNIKMLWPRLTTKTPSEMLCTVKWVILRI